MLITILISFALGFAFGWLVARTLDVAIEDEQLDEPYDEEERS